MINFIHWEWYASKVILSVLALLYLFMMGFVLVSILCSE